MTNDSRNSVPAHCQQFQDALQQFLDGGQGEFSAELQSHRAGCADCLSRFHAAVLLRSALPLMPDVKPTDNWTKATSAALLADSFPSQMRQGARWKVVVVAAVAAALLLAVGIWRPWSPEGFVRQGTIAKLPPTAEHDLRTHEHLHSPPIYVDKGLSEARSLVSDLTRRTADGAVEPTRTLLPIDAPPSPLAVKDSLPRAMDPATESLQDIRQGAASGLEPVANTARRAFAMFIREVPTLNPERKPDS